MADMRVISFSYDMSNHIVEMSFNQDFENLDALTRADVLGDILSYMDKVRDMYDQAVEEFHND